MILYYLKEHAETIEQLRLINHLRVISWFMGIAMLYTLFCICFCKNLKAAGE